MAALIGEFITLTAIGWSVICFIAGLFPIVVYWQERTNWAYLIPTYVFWIIGIFIAFISWNIIQDEAIAVFVLWSIALPFVIGYLRNRHNWGLLIPAYVLVMVGDMVGLIGLRILSDLLGKEI